MLRSAGPFAAFILEILPIVAGAVSSIITFFIVSYIETKVTGKMA